MGGFAGEWLPSDRTDGIRYDNGRGIGNNQPSNAVFSLCWIGGPSTSGIFLSPIDAPHGEVGPLALDHKLPESEGTL